MYIYIYRERERYTTTTTNNNNNNNNNNNHNDTNDKHITLGAFCIMAAISAVLHSAKGGAVETGFSGSHYIKSCVTI